MIAMEVGDIMMAIKKLLFLILFFQYYTFLDDKVEWKHRNDHTSQFM